MTAFYNECDPFAAQWLHNLIAAGHIAAGVVDERPIQEIEPYELVGFTQCHFFAGVGVWSYALRQAGWPDDRPIWTGSCPCQPFSKAGKQKGFDDERHLWPTWFNLIRECKPAIVIGEQVAGALDWLDLVSADMEASDYAFGASDLCAAGFGGAQIRQRLYFIGMADCDDAGLERRDRVPERRDQCIARESRLVGGMADTLPTGRTKRGSIAGNGSSPRGGSFSGGTVLHPRQARSLDNVDWLLCRNPAGEPSWRPVEPGTFPLAHGVAARMGKLRAYGNALDAETATEFCHVVREIAGV